jgi:hypothetical protein
LAVFCLCFACVLPGFCMCFAWVLHVFCMCFACVLHVSCMCLACVSHVLRLCFVCLLLWFCMCFACVLHVFCMCFACVLHVSCMCLACVLHVFCMWFETSRNVLEFPGGNNTIENGASETAHLRRFCRNCSVIPGTSNGPSWNQATVQHCSGDHRITTLFVTLTHVEKQRLKKCKKKKQNTCKKNKVGALQNWWPWWPLQPSWCLPDLHSASEKSLDVFFLPKTLVDLIPNAINITKSLEYIGVSVFYMFLHST